MLQLNTRQVPLRAIMNAVSIVGAYSKGLALSSLPGLYEFTTSSSRAAASGPSWEALWGRSVDNIHADTIPLPGTFIQM